MVTLIPLIIILGDPYKISITTKNTLRYIIKKILGIHGSIIIDQSVKEVRSKPSARASLHQALT